MKKNQADGNAVHHTEVAVLLPLSPSTGRLYTTQTVRRWLDEGVLRTCHPPARRGVHAVRADVERLAERLRVRDQGLPHPARDQVGAVE